MNDDELNKILTKAEDEYEQLKDRCHDLYAKLSERGTMTFIKKESLNNWVAKYFKQDLISVDDLLGCIEDLNDEVETLRDKIKDMEQDISENYRRIPVKEQVE